MNNILAALALVALCGCAALDDWRALLCYETQLFQECKS